MMYLKTLQFFDGTNVLTSFLEPLMAFHLDTQLQLRYLSADDVSVPLSSLTE